MYIFLDFNGTIINDVELGHSIINKMLDMLNIENISLDKYRHIFTFPITDYYKAAGIDLEKNDFNQLANFYIKEYKSREHEGKINEEIIDLVKYLKKKHKVLVFSATPIDLLIKQLKSRNIYDLFDDVIGINDTYANVGKEVEALNYIKKHNINPKDVFIIGDTLHEYKISKQLKTNCILIPFGHQDYDLLSKTNVVVSKINDIKDIL